MPDRLPERFFQPRAVATTLAGLYILLSVAYVLTSTHVAAASAQSVGQLEQFERIKGVLFVLGTGTLFYFVALHFVRRLQRQREALLESEHRALSGLFASAIAHDINNLTMVGRGSMDLVLHPDARPEAKTKAAANLNDAFLRLSALSQRLMTLGSSSTAGTVEDRDLVAAIERSLALARRHARVRNCRLSAFLGKPLVMRIDEVLVDRMILNLVLNAAEATQGSGRIDVRLHRRDDGVAIEVHDDGPGVAAEVRDAIFDPFYSSKASGMGLGLLSVRACAEAHGGSVDVGASDLGGACFRITLSLGGPGTARRS